MCGVPKPRMGIGTVDLHGRNVHVMIRISVHILSHSRDFPHGIVVKALSGVLASNVHYQSSHASEPQ